MDTIRVLIIEDDFRVANINKKYTEKVDGFEVCGITSTVKEAMQELPKLQPDLVLLDVYFPDGNGLDVLWHLRKYFREVDIILITAAQEVETVQEAIRGGVIDYIIKPFLYDRFETTLRKYAEYRRQLITTDTITQESVDLLLQGVRENSEQEHIIPKGIDPLTLQKVQEKISAFSLDGITAENFGKQIGLSRTTTRRYLEYMVSLGDISAELAYGQVGRPERLYRKV
ncbi:response regulator [Sporosarcina sp.]|uniref:response regulator n=1 Tax=Sporosarcina sp. TaxID=49982 RepID=UPI00261A3DCE|nr:response regulator [Sporosarcina sp.]